jgi:cystathionine beta-lyase
MTAKKTYSRPDTILAVAGRDPDNNFGIVNPPVYHASTIPRRPCARRTASVRRFGLAATHADPEGTGDVAAIEGGIARSPCSPGSPPSPASRRLLQDRRSLLLTDKCGPARRFANTTLELRRRDDVFYPMIGAASRS